MLANELPRWNDASSRGYGITNGFFGAKAIRLTRRFRERPSDDGQSTRDDGYAAWRQEYR